MFAKDSICLELCVDKDDYYPGETILGTITVHVSSETECSGIRVSIRCVADTTVQVTEHQGGEQRTVTYRDSEDYVEHYINCYGFSKSSERKGGCFLYPGNEYTYNFAYPIPLNVPGSAHYSSMSASFNVAWLLKGYVDIPRGFDKNREITVFVRTPAPSSQIWGRPLALPPRSQNVASCGCTGCYCCATGDQISVAPVITPAVGLVQCNGYTNGQPAGALRFDVAVDNVAEGLSLNDARVVIEQRITVTARGRSRVVTGHISESRLSRISPGGYNSGGGYGGGEYGSAMDLGAQRAASSSVVFSGTVALDPKDTIPSMFCNLIMIEHSIEIDFPHSKVKEGLFENALTIANGEDGYNQVWPLPRRYQTVRTFTENTL